MIPTRTTRRAALLLAAIALPLLATRIPHATGAEPRVLPMPTIDEPPTHVSQTAILAGGCFWGVQGVFQHVRGVTSAISGYTGGKQATADYETVSTGTTGHAESVQITYDPSQISYGRILDIYFSVAHDPTEHNEQGPDTGTQYRSAIFPTTPAQARIAQAYIAQLDATHLLAAPIATTIEPGRTFYPAEAYHQNFLTLNPSYPYIAINDLPKVEALKTDFPAQYRADPVLVPTSSGS